ncbi:hypothetical protein FS749_009165 [Ceratobasidium sp. UAMH 11750]|nr:hypothetical protein FS749_009165 [Ceratobasidium sp. UAMH 11750]
MAVSFSEFCHLRSVYHTYQKTPAPYRRLGDLSDILDKLFPLDEMSDPPDFPLPKDDPRFNPPWIPQEPPQPEPIHDDEPTFDLAHDYPTSVPRPPSSTQSSVSHARTSGGGRHENTNPTRNSDVNDPLAAASTSSAPAGHPEQSASSRRRRPRPRPRSSVPQSSSGQVPNVPFVDANASASNQRPVLPPISTYPWPPDQASRSASTTSAPTGAPGPAVRNDPTPSAIPPGIFTWPMPSPNVTSAYPAPTRPSAALAGAAGSFGSASVSGHGGNHPATASGPSVPADSAPDAAGSPHLLYPPGPFPSHNYSTPGTQASAVAPAQYLSQPPASQSEPIVITLSPSPLPMELDHGGQPESQPESQVELQPGSQAESQVELQPGSQAESQPGLPLNSQTTLQFESLPGFELENDVDDEHEEEATVGAGGTRARPGGQPYISPDALTELLRFPRKGRHYTVAEWGIIIWFLFHPDSPLQRLRDALTPGGYRAIFTEVCTLTHKRNAAPLLATYCNGNLDW